uniref:C-type lectin domain-containing protein n=1 Tax=Mustela putorius furo TaxID=9669 RepID=M3Y460_MUSPF
MAGDTIYADIKIDRTVSLKKSSSLQKFDSHHHGIFLKVGCAMIITLFVAVIVLSILIIQLKYARHNAVENESKEKFCTGKNKSEVITSTVSFNFSAAHKSCPSKDWKLHGGKCYWIAEDKKSWDESKNDCAMKNSHLLVIRDFIDMIRKNKNVSFAVPAPEEKKTAMLKWQGIPPRSLSLVCPVLYGTTAFMHVCVGEKDKCPWGTGAKHRCTCERGWGESFLWRYLNTSVFYWIGLSIPPGRQSWTWVDNKPFDSHLFSIEEKRITRSTKCAQVSRRRVANQNCEQNDQWICQL